MIQRKFNIVLGVLAMLLFGSTALAQENAMQAMGKANAKVAKAASHKNHWDGPTDGPKLQNKKRVVFIAGDMVNTVVAELYKGTKEAAAMAGWEVLLIDCRAACYQGAPVINQALAMKPDGIILAGVDAQSQAKGLDKAQEKKIPVVGWHAIAKPGPVDGLFANVGNNPRESAQIAALYGVTEVNSKMGMVIFTDNSTPYLSAKSSALIEIIKQCDICRLLSVEEMPVSDASAKMQQTVDDLVKHYGSKWTHVIAVSDVYFDVMEKPAIAALIAGNKLKGLSAGDGSVTSYQRIHANNVQIGTVPEPANMQGWQLVDELNRAFSGVAASGYSMPVHLATNQNIPFDGGDKNVFEPDNDYRNQYRKYWVAK
ncbi:substrate-binding domain-containing protein [Solimicrobium silvestre]|uniref:Periplasmic binding protein domain n=1 Tax=Solimicrobium silvestre TaxID=2099400 RepID=A0A2S9H1A6_9BURK|nr:substrate-binding domain-containing protein [Solimicrobium silvestre]PRC93723.1 Periplasmic binding protein domain [Solimicrobium silvestre]